jgi:Cysteine-rich CPCC
MFICPVCDYITLAEFGAHEICAVCAWEADGLDLNEPHLASQSNGNLTLFLARRNFGNFGACADSRRLEKTVDLKLFVHKPRIKVFLVCQLLALLKEQGIGISHHACGIPDCELAFGLEAMKDAHDKSGFITCAFGSLGPNTYVSCDVLCLTSKLATLPALRELVFERAKSVHLLLEMDSTSSVDSWRQQSFQIAVEKKTKTGG